MIDITFLGTAANMPETGGDSTCFLINEHILVDTGWNAPMRLPIFGHDPLKITHLLFTHFHPDHYVALPQLLLQRAVFSSRSDVANLLLPPLIIAGPVSGLETVVSQARQFLAGKAYTDVQLIPLRPGDTLTCGTLTVMVGRSTHEIPAHGYRFTDDSDGTSLGITGDTEYTKNLPPFFQGVDLLVAEATFGANPADVPTFVKHMGAPDAARLAKKAGAKRLALVHSRQVRRIAAVKAAQEIFPETFWPADGQRVTVRPASAE